MFIELDKLQDVFNYTPQIQAGDKQTEAGAVIAILISILAVFISFGKMNFPAEYYSFTSMPANFFTPDEFNMSISI